MSKSKGKSESNSELRSKFSAGELDTIDKIVDEIEKFKEIIGGKCDQGSDLGAAEAAHIPPPQATQLPTQVVSLPLSPLESKVSDFISNSFHLILPTVPIQLITQLTILLSLISLIVLLVLLIVLLIVLLLAILVILLLSLIVLTLLTLTLTLLILATIVLIVIIVRLIITFVTLVAIVIILVSPILLISKQSTLVLIVLTVLIVLIGLRDSLRLLSLSLKLLVTTDKFNS